MEGLIFRNDDVSPSTDLDALHDYYEVIARAFPEARIISVVSLFGSWNERGSVYPDLPLKTKDKQYFYEANRFLSKHSHVIGDIASHGLFHVKHSELSRDAQEMSIVSSCYFLNTDKFVAPFNDYDDVTLDVCRSNNIELVNERHDWRSLDFNKFDSKHKYWYLHSWRYTPKQLKEKFDASKIGNSSNMGFV